MDDRQQCEVARGLHQSKTEAWRALYDAYSRQVWRSVARQMGPDSADVADVVQETFLAAARSARRYDASRGSLWMWLCGIARRQVALHYRKQQRQERLRQGDQPSTAGRQILRWLEDRQETPGDALASAELASLVRATLTALPADYETLLTAKYFDEARVEQMADLEQCSSTAIRSKLARARLAFRRAFAQSSAGSHGDRGRQDDES